MTTYIKRVFGIRQTIERTLDERDDEILDSGIRLVDENGKTIKTMMAADINAAGGTRIVASRDIRTGEWRSEEAGTFPLWLLDAPDGTKWISTT